MTISHNTFDLTTLDPSPLYKAMPPKQGPNPVQGSPLYTPSDMDLIAQGLSFVPMDMLASYWNAFLSCRFLDFFFQIYVAFHPQ